MLAIDHATEYVLRGASVVGSKFRKTGFRPFDESTLKGTPSIDARLMMPLVVPLSAAANGGVALIGSVTSPVSFKRIGWATP